MKFFLENEYGTLLKTCFFAKAQCSLDCLMSKNCDAFKFLESVSKDIY